jgi:hypothetical protein
MKSAVWGLLSLLLISTAYGSDSMIQVSCQTVHVQDASDSLYADETLSFERRDCHQSSGANGLLLSSPSLIMKKFKVQGSGRRGVIQTASGEYHINYLDAQKTVVETEYHIPDCGNVGRKWRIQLGAIVDSGRVANEEFFHTIRAVVKSCQLKHGDMKNIRFCKTNGESFGHQKQEGNNATSRLFAILDTEEPMISEPAARAILHQSCRDKVEHNACADSLDEQCEARGLYGKLVNCMGDVQTELADNLLLKESVETVRKLWIVPPKDILNENFEVQSNKYQFLTCRSLAVSPALKN